MAKKKAPKKSAKAVAAPSSTGKSARLVAPAGGVVVRMYRQGLGDCFLLAFGGKGKKSAANTRYVLIDCGVHKRQVDGPVRLTRVMNDVLDSTGGRLDVVVATHEHADHLSGFVQKGSPFLAGKFQIDDLWVAWTEKVGDKLADRLRRRRATARSVVEKAVEQATKSAADAGAKGFTALQAAMSDLHRELKAAMDFEDLPNDESQPDADRAEAEQFIAKKVKDATKAGRGLHRFLEAGAAPAPGLGASGVKAKKKPSSNELALGVLEAQAKDVQYCVPGELYRIPDVDGVRVHVLGPPHDEQKLQKDLPSKVRGANDGEDKFKEVYLAGSGEGFAFRLSPALGGEFFDKLMYPEDLRHPFEYSQRRSLPDGPGATTGGPKSGTMRAPSPATRSFLDDTYFDSASDWRRVDGDWLAAAGELALNLDSDTNNTSLVLAFEWNKRVLLFAGDAQVGNWLSWRDQPYKDEKGKAIIPVADLLERTLVYKVGHHGSHNATLKRDPAKTDDANPLGMPFGLELMNDIIALIPVDRAAAERDMPNPWEMPHQPLYERLREKARRRVLRADAKRNVRPLKASAPDDVVPPSAKESKVPDMKGATWRRSKETLSGADDPLYYEITFT